MTEAETVETPSGKTSKDENFPVGSWLLPKALRPHVATFYAFARAADDIADNGFLTAEEKVARLDGFEAALTGRITGDPAYEKSYAMRRSLAQTGSTPRHCIDLLAAFKQDATKLRYRDWDDLIGYCVLSASPVGRYLLDLHGQRRDLYPVSDALCNALQILNHLQDCQKDYRQLDRVYLPGDWLAAEGATVEDLDKSAATPGMRRVLDRTLDGVDVLLAEAVMLPKVLSNARLSMESAVTVNLALRLARHLRRGDPLATRVALTRLDFARCGAAGVLQGVFR
ncbi:MAG: squalene synthase HpnC [Rhodospirillales bacterium]